MSHDKASLCVLGQCYWTLNIIATLKEEAGCDVLQMFFFPRFAVSGDLQNSTEGRGLTILDASLSIPWRFFMIDCPCCRTLHKERRWWWTHWWLIDKNAKLLLIPVFFKLSKEIQLLNISTDVISVRFSPQVVANVCPRNLKESVVAMYLYAQESCYSNYTIL